MTRETRLNRPIHVLGAGGIGVVMAWCLARAGNEVTVVENNPDKLRAGRENGLLIEGHEPCHPAFIHYDDWRPGGDDLILLCTKTYTNVDVLKKLSGKANLVPVQNGFDRLLEAQAHAGEGIVSFVSECRRDKPVTRITRAGEFHLGPRRVVNESEHNLLTALGNALASAKLFPVHVVDDILPYKYTKLMYNAAISPLAASAGVDNAALLDDPLAKQLFFALIKENYAILKQAGVHLAKIGPMHPDSVNRLLTLPLLPDLMAVFFKPSLRGTYCSMSPDMGSGQTEIDAYNGYLIALAGDYPCPLNRAAHALVKRITAERRPPDRKYLQDLADALPAGGLV
jgi:2-dehydropantoate 2-reductase